MNMSFQSKRLLAVCLLVLATGLVASFLFKSVSSTSANKRKVPLITLVSSEQVLENVRYGSALTSASLTDDKQIYLLRQDTANVAVFDSERKQSKKDLVSFSPTAKQAQATPPPGFCLGIA